MREVHLIILDILDAENRWMFGIEMVKTSEGKLKRGMMSVPLAELMDKGLVKFRMDPDFKPKDERELQRRQYHITHDGRSARRDANEVENHELQPIRI